MPELRNGITVGKFMPLHKGHELMIEFASLEMGSLTVLVSGKFSDEIPLFERVCWVRDFVESRKLDNVDVQLHVDKSPTPINVDENGTVLDVDFQLYWANEFTKHGGNDLTHIVSSDFYGKVIADRMGLKWFPVDPDREMINISATEIRENPMRHFNMISDAAKPYFVKKVAIVGAESTGKSTLVKRLAERFGVHFANEYGRTITMALGDQFTEDDFENIMFGQHNLIEMADRRNVADGNKLTLTDTEAYITYLFSKVYLGEYMPKILEFAQKQKIDHYIVLAPTVKYVQDGTRVMEGEQERLDFHNNIVNLLEENNETYTVIDTPLYGERYDAASEVIKNLNN